MNTLRIVLLSFLVLASMPAMAAQSIAVVDMQKAMTTSKAAKHILDQVNDYRAPLAKAFEKREKALLDQQKELEALQKAGDREGFANLAQKLQADQIVLKQDVARMRKTITDAVAKGEAEILDSLLAVIEDIAAKKEYSLVLRRASVVLGANNTDITKDVLKALNKKTTKIKLNFKD